ncbi:Charged multivesicular body protein 1a [Blyttiomyces sp. JEL0837]|nr:Charged multivesicular body protein 1a [Blyttiomyces sp. JEL0837]
MFGGWFDGTPSVSAMEKSLFQLKFTSKQLENLSKKARKEEAAELAKVKKALQKNDTEVARIHASNAIRKKAESLNHLRLSARVDAMASKISTAISMKSLTKTMGTAVSGMDKAMATMDLNKMAEIMGKFESQMEDMEVAGSVMEDAVNTGGTLEASDEVEQLMASIAEEAMGLPEVPASSLAAAPTKVKAKAVANEEDDELEQRLAMLRSI